MNYKGNVFDSVMNAVVLFRKLVIRNFWRNSVIKKLRKFLYVIIFISGLKYI